MTRSLNVAVVGAGMSGLVAIKELLDEGHKVTCFERCAKEGGNFNYPVGVAYDSMYLTVSQYHMAFSCFPPPQDQERRYWKREEYASYLNDFGNHFGLFPHIRFNTDVLGIQIESPEKYRVTTKDKDSGAVTEQEFDAIAVCSGAHAVHIPRIPKFEGAESFRGEIVHSATYRSPEPFRGKNVVCVGFGETGADVTYQIAEVANSCWLTFRRYPSVLKRWYGEHTNDAYATRLQGWLPRFALNEIHLRHAKKDLESPTTCAGDRILAEWTLKCGTPSHQPFEKNDDFLDSIVSGKLQVKPAGIERLDGDSIVFTDGTRIQADVLMCCTGYYEGQPPSYFFNGIEFGGVRDLYKHVFHPDLGERVAFIGWARPAQGGIPACSEMQSRYYSLLLSGKRKLPEKAELLQLIAKDREFEESSFYARKYQGTIVSYTPYMDSVAELVDCKPRLSDYLLNPRLLYHLLCGANVPTAYRLRGPHAQAEMAKRVVLSLPVPYTLREILSFGYLHIVQLLGLLKPKQVHPA